MINEKLWSVDLVVSRFRSCMCGYTFTSEEFSSVNLLACLVEYLVGDITFHSANSCCPANFCLFFAKYIDLLAEFNHGYFVHSQRWYIDGLFSYRELWSCLIMFMVDLVLCSFSLQPDWIKLSMLSTNRLRATVLSRLVTKTMSTTLFPNS